MPTLLNIASFHVDIETFIFALIASSGFWGLVTTITNHVLHKKSVKDSDIQAMKDGIRGILYDKIIERCQRAIDEGFISPDDYDDLIKYNCKPYKDLGGDGTVDRIMLQVKALPNSPSNK